MSDRASPLGAEFKRGQRGNLTSGIGVTLSETDFSFLGELAVFPDAFAKIEVLVASLLKADDMTAFKIAANRWFLAGPETLDEAIRKTLKPVDGSLIDLSHGRTALRISGPKAEWVLSKLYAIDFSLAAFPAETGLSTTHHTIFTQIHRRDEQTFDLFIFRSFARSFWHTLQRAAEETGYEVV